MTAIENDTTNLRASCEQGDVTLAMPVRWPPPYEPRPKPKPPKPPADRGTSVSAGPDRRSILAGILAALATPAVAQASPTASEMPIADSTVTRSPASAAGHPDVELIALCARYIASLHAYMVSDPFIDELDSNPDWIACREAGEALHAARAQTIEGVMAKARAAQVEANYWAGNIEEYEPGDDPAAQFAWEIVCDLVAIEEASA